MKARLAFTLSATLLACAPPASPTVPRVILHGTDGAAVSLDDTVRAHPFTVVTFFSADCPCQRAHDARLLALLEKDAPRGVAFLIVDSEERATSERDALLARERGYPILLDDRAALARALDAEYATFSVVVDRDGRVVYRGGIDGDKSHLRDDRPRYLEDALDDALAGRPLRVAEAKTLGCTLQIR